MSKNLTKIFCIGLHKTGTTSLHKIAENNGFKSTHSTDWYYNPMKISNFNFFCDGGSHYDNQNEIDYVFLEKTYLNSIFIINIREIKSWIISKLKHAGWREDTKIVPDNNDYKHNGWKIKSLRNIQLFITHYYNRYIMILEYFLDKQNKAYIVDICNKKINNLKILMRNNNIKMFYENRSNKHISLSKKVIEFIEHEIYVVNKDKQNKLLYLINKFNY
jgi:hypothetical protein